MNDDEIFKYVQPNYSEQELRTSFANLAKSKLDGIEGKIKEDSNTIGLKHVGSNCSNHFFFRQRLYSTRNGHSTLFDFVRKVGLEEWQRRTVQGNNSNLKKRGDLSKATPKDYESAGNATCRIPCQFKPRVAAVCVEIFKPTSVMDFSAGWGDRALGFCAKKVKYTGIDSNVELKSCYEQMSSFFDIQPQMFFQPSETFDFSKHVYDMVFTSPPYFDLEVYRNNPAYDGYEAWVTQFLKPVVERSYESLSSNGWFCMNVCTSELRNGYPIYESLVKLLGVETKRIKMYNQGGSKSADEFNYEYIYCWQKGQEVKQVNRVITIEGVDSFEFKNGTLVIRLK